jgi:hypothetical protein
MYIVKCVLAALGPARIASFALSGNLYAAAASEKGDGFMTVKDLCEALDNSITLDGIIFIATANDILEAADLMCMNISTGSYRIKRTRFSCN